MVDHINISIFICNINDNREKVIINVMLEM